MYFALQMHSLDILLPAYNPLPDWEETVIQRFKSIESRFPKLVLHLYIVNDGSSRLNNAESEQKIRSRIANFTWVSYPDNRGKGYALRQGMAQTQGDAVIFTDIDWPYTEESMSEMIRLLQDDADVVIGIRNEDYYLHLPPMRSKISKWLRRFNGKLLHLKVDDTQAGLKGFRKELKPVFLKTTINRYLFDLEFIYKLSKSNWKVISLPIALRPGITFSKMNKKILLQEAWNFLKIWMR